MIEPKDPSSPETIVQTVGDGPNSQPKPAPWIKTKQGPESIPEVSWPPAEIHEKSIEPVDTIACQKMRKRKRQHDVKGPRFPYDLDVVRMGFVFHN